MIANVLQVGQSMTMSQLMKRLIALYPNDPYAFYKAAGSIGGARRHMTIIPIVVNDVLTYVRVA